MNPLLAEVKAGLTALVSSDSPDQAVLRNCMIKLAEFWRQYYVGEAELLQQVGKTGFPEANAAYLEQKGVAYGKILDPCQRAEH